MKSLITKFSGLVAICTATLISCEKAMVDPEHVTSQDNFTYVWQKFDEHYGLFEVKNIDWNAVYNDYYPQAQAVKTDAELFNVLSGMIRTLDDKHVNIYTTDPTLRDYNSGLGGPATAQEDFLFDVVQNNYLAEYHQLNDEMGYGKLPGNIGYIRLSAFKQELKTAEPVVEKMISRLGDSKGIIVDIRDHTGGDDRVSKYLAGRFAKSRRLFMTTKKRNGPAHTDFDKTLSWYVEPSGQNQYTKPVVLLTSKHSISAAETFTLAMKENENVTQVGDTTAGAFSDQVFFEMPNSWLFSVGVGDYRASDGKSYEGIGLAPEVYLVDQKAELLAGSDKLLEKAVQMLK